MPALNPADHGSNQHSCSLEGRAAPSAFPGAKLRKLNPGDQRRGIADVRVPYTFRWQSAFFSSFRYFLLQRKRSMVPLGVAFGTWY
jgi:hypothetical protein